MGAEPTDGEPRPERTSGFDAQQFDTSFTRTRAGRAVRWVVVRLGLGALLRVVAPCTVEGADRATGMRGPVLVIANHHSHADTAVLLAALPRTLTRRMVVAAAADVFFASRTAATIYSLCFGLIPVDRTRVSRRTLELCVQLLEERWTLLIYPEGRRSPAATMSPFKPGAAWVACRAGATILPVHIDGTATTLPKGSSIPRRAPVRIRIGEPVAVSEDDDPRELTNRLALVIADLGGLEAPPQQATRASRRQATTQPGSR